MPVLSVFYGIVVSMYFEKDARVSNALGYKHKLCEGCIADEYKIGLDELRSTLEHHFGMRPCLGI